MERAELGTADAGAPDGAGEERAEDTKDDGVLPWVLEELGTADPAAGVPNGTGSEVADTDTDDNSDGEGDAVAVIVGEDLADLEWRAADGARCSSILGRWPQLMHAYSGCSHAHGNAPGSGRTGMSPTAVDSRAGLATGDV